MINVLEILEEANQHAKKLESAKISAKLTTTCFIPAMNESAEFVVIMRSFFRKSPRISSGVIHASEGSNHQEIIFHADEDTIYQKVDGKWHISTQDVSINPIKEANKLSEYYELFKKMEEKLTYAVVDDQITLSLTISKEEILENASFFEKVIDGKVPLDYFISISFFMTFINGQLSLFRMSTNIEVEEQHIEMTAESTISEQNQHNDLIIPRSVIQAALS